MNELPWWLSFILFFIGVALFIGISCLFPPIRAWWISRWEMKKWEISEAKKLSPKEAVKILKDILIPVPNIDKQKEVLKKISIIEDLQLENLYKQKKNLMKSLKSSMVNNLIILDNKAA